MRLAYTLVIFGLAQYKKGPCAKSQFFHSMYDANDATVIPSQAATIILFSPAELSTIVLILHISQTGKQLCHYILSLHTGKPSTPSLTANYY